jgi:hypothetical protein
MVSIARDMVAAKAPHVPVSLLWEVTTTTDEYGILSNEL